MNSYDAARLLAKALRESPEVSAYREAAGALKNDESARDMLRDLRIEQFKLQKQRLTGLETAPEQEEKLEKLSQIVGMNLVAKRLMEAEYRLGVMMNDIQKIIAEATEDLFDADLLGLSAIADEMAEEMEDDDDEA